MIKKHGGNIYEFAEKHGIKKENVIDFSANINPLGLSKHIKTALNDESIILNYPDPNYTALKHKIAAFENVAMEHIIIGNGGIECLFLLAEALKDKKVVIVVPTFVEYERAFSKFSKIEFFYLNDDFTLDIEALIEFSQGSDVVMICNPNNPTGHLIKKEKLLYLSEQTNQLLIVDEAFIDFTDDEASNTLVDQIQDNDQWVILKSLTKFFAIPGLRLGYLMTSHQQILNHINENRMPWSINGIAAKVGETILEDDDYIHETKKWIKTERQWFLDALAALKIQVYPTQGNYVFFKGPIGLDVLLAKKGIMIRNCSNYEGLDEGYFRIAIKERSLNKRLLEEMKEILWIS